MKGDLTFDDVTVLDTIDSTNDAAKRRLARSAKAPFVIAAREQVNGRGRSGRSWSSKPGNLAATFYYPFAGSHQEAARISFAVALAVRDVLGKLASGVAAGIKWPNDVLLNQKKVCGILLENQGHLKNGHLQMIIGIGINLTHHPDPTESNWTPTSIAAETGINVEFEVALTALIEALQIRLRVDATEGFARIRRDWLAHSVRLRETILVRLPFETLEGVFRDIDDTGALVLETSSGVRKITAGDVFFPRDAECS